MTLLIRLIRRTTVLKRLTKDVSHFQLEMRRTPRDCNGTLCWIEIVQVVKRKKSNNNRYKGDSVRGTIIVVSVVLVYFFSDSLV